ncbi:hypothetical protein SBI_00020 [Streptomyces bingchenggensis BCW-1]|uniref:Uncharacterized protein n=1 Tax=Streptomyces bingchenggensis (strain BCW-1) TaxID=749414 RepID=D7BSW4_STRBB|nr:hypothetical protein SBI_00020 [Streptomyces bingchenggensis BCW-1]
MFLVGPSRLPEPREEVFLIKDGSPALPDEVGDCGLGRLFFHRTHGTNFASNCHG